MDALAIGFEIPMVGLVVAVIVLGIGLFMSGLNVVTYVGLAIGFLSIVGLVATAVSVPEPEPE